jgi:hypothetical protein
MGNIDDIRMPTGVTHKCIVEKFHAVLYDTRVLKVNNPAVRYNGDTAFLSRNVY